MPVTALKMANAAQVKLDVTVSLDSNVALLTAFGGG
jgi:hypothetical protein